MLNFSIFFFFPFSSFILVHLVRKKSFIPFFSYQKKIFQTSDPSYQLITPSFLSCQSSETVTSSQLLNRIQILDKWKESLTKKQCLFIAVRFLVSCEIKERKIS